MLNYIKKDRVNRLYYYFYGVIIFLITYFIARRPWGDYQYHWTWLPTIQQLFHPLAYMKTNVEPLWHQLTKVVSYLFEVPNGDAGGIVTGLSNVATYIIIYSYLKKYTEKANFVAFLCMIAGPVWIPWFNKGNMYLGQGSPNVWHNPTLLLVRPFAYWIIILSIEILEKPIIWTDYKTEWKSAFILSLMILLSGFAKPAFYQFFFPAIFIYCVILVLCDYKKYFCNSFLLFLSCIPTVILFIIQYVFLFSSKTGGNENGVFIKFLYVMKMHSPNPLFSSFLCILFPVVMLVYVLFSKKIDKMYLFSWLCYLVAWLEAALLVEKKHPYHGNFTWGLALASSIVFCFSVLQYIKNFINPNDDDDILNGKKRNWFFVCTCSLLFQIIFGAIYVYRVLILRNYL